MGNYTRLGAAIWDWDPWTTLPPIPRLLWLAIYTSPEAKKGVPGLFHGSLHSLAEASRLPTDEMYTSIDVLLDRDMIEYDKNKRVLRLCELPDAGDWPSGTFVLQSWWKRFRSVPACPVRDAHVATLRWMLEQGALEADSNRGGRVSAGHENVWAATFGTIVVPSSRRRGVRRLADSDTGTNVQPSLFGNTQGATPSATPSAVLCEPELSSSPSGASGSGTNKIRYSGCHPGGSEEVGVGEEGEVDLLFSPPDPEQVSAGGGGSGEGSSEVKRPLLTLVPSPAIVPFSVDHMLELLRATLGGVWSVDAGDYQRLTEDFEGLRRLGYDDTDFALLGDWMRAKGLSPRGAQDLLVCRGQLASAFSRAQAWREETNNLARQAAQRSADLRAALSEAGM